MKKNIKVILKNKYDFLEPFTVDDILQLYPEKTKDSIKKMLSREVENGRLVRWSKGVYYIPHPIAARNKELTLERVVYSIYIKRCAHSKVCGYGHYTYLAEDLGIIEESNNTLLKIVSNKATASKRIINFKEKGQIELYAPRLEVKDTNCWLLPLLDLFYNQNKLNSSMDSESIAATIIEDMKRDEVFSSILKTKFVEIKEAIDAYPNSLIGKLFNSPLSFLLDEKQFSLWKEQCMKKIYEDDQESIEDFLTSEEEISVLIYAYYEEKFSAYSYSINDILVKVSSKFAFPEGMYSHAFIIDKFEIIQPQTTDIEPSFIVKADLILNGYTIPKCIYEEDNIYLLWQVLNKSFDMSQIQVVKYSTK